MNELWAFASECIVSVNLQPRIMFVSMLQIFFGSWRFSKFGLLITAFNQIQPHLNTGPQEEENAVILITSK